MYLSVIVNIQVYRGEMKLTVVRTQFGTDATNGILLIDGVFECFTLEDQYQAVKVMHETCIPEGTYDIGLENRWISFQYSERYKNAHYGSVAYIRCT